MLSFEELRQKAKQKLSDWMETFSYDEREVIKYSDGYYCNDWNSNLKFKTPDINIALDFLFPN